MTEKDYQLYGTKVLNLKTQEIGLLICIWENKFADKTVDYATCVDKLGRRYSIELDNIDTLKKVILSIQAITDVYSVKRIQTSYSHAPKQFAKKNAPKKKTKQERKSN